MGGANDDVGEGRDAAAKSAARRRNRVECDDDDDDNDDDDDDDGVGADRIDDDLMDECVFYSSYLFDVARHALSSPERDDRERYSRSLSDLMMVSLWTVDGGRRGA